MRDLLHSFRANHAARGSGADKGTVWLIFLGWCASAYAGVVFRSQDVPATMRTWLLPNFFYDIGIVLIFFGVAVRCGAVWTLGSSFTHNVTTTEEQHLMHTGFYRFVRNPAYSGSILSLLGISFVFRHILGFICVLVICFICYGVRIRVEETALEKQFGEEFEDYCAHTRYRLFPGIY